MTIAELRRAVESRRRVYKQKMQERASMDYLLADMIGRSVARIYSKSNKMPELAEVYPNLFDSVEIEEQKAVKRAELSAARFKQFAETHNKKFRGEAKTE